MSHKGLYYRIRAAVTGAAICLVLMYSYIGFVSFDSSHLLTDDKKRILSWFIALMGTAIPLIVAIIFAWKISCMVKEDKTFSVKTAFLLKGISNCAFIDGIYFLVVNIVMIFLDYNHPAIVIISFAAISLTLAAGMAFTALARFVQKAADLQKESDLTI